MQHSRTRLLSGLSVALMGLALSACATTAVKNPPGIAASAGFGDAVRHNIEIQAVAPTEAQKNDRMIPADPDRRRKALENYKNDEVPEPKAVNTAPG